MLHPKAIFIQLTTACNAKCINCPHSFTYGEKGCHLKGVMTDDVWSKILRDMQSMGYGGQVGFYLHHEPLLSPSLFDKIKQVNELTNAYVVISTNGALLDARRREKLIEARPHIVHVNINSADKLQYEEMTGLDFDKTIENTKRFIDEANGKIEVEINCAAMPGVDTTKLVNMFSGTTVNSEYWANSRGGLLSGITCREKGSRFKISGFCMQPIQNFNILYDGSVILCCIDWMHESKADFPSIMEKPIVDIYNGEIMKSIVKEFKAGNYSRYHMCSHCAVEMGFVEEVAHPRESLTRVSANRTDTLRILLTNHHLLDFTGSEIFTFTIADFLKRKGHEVIVYSKYVDQMLPSFQSIKVPVVQDLALIKSEKFDIAHVHHNINAIEIRYHFRELPIVFLSHGILPFLEQPPHIDLNISKFLAVSEEVKQNLAKNGVKESDIKIYRNIVDSQKFCPVNRIRSKPEKALILSNRIDIRRENVIKEACKKLNIQCKFIGSRFGEIEQALLPHYINDADIVFSLGRGAIESMLHGRVPIIFDYLGGDGMVTPENIKEIMKCNFSGRRYRINYTVDGLVNEIEKYRSEYGDNLREIALKYFAAENQIDVLIGVYEQSIKKSVERVSESQSRLLDAFMHTIIETRNYAYENLTRQINQKQQATRKRLEEKSTQREVASQEIEARRSNMRIGLTSGFSNKENKFCSRSKLSSERKDTKRNLCVSIIIPVFNKVEYTKKCINAIYANTQYRNFEIIIVDNSSSDGTRQYLQNLEKKISNVKVIYNKNNLGFAKANNQAAAIASGKYLVFLNNDTVPQPGWLEEMLKIVESDEKVGVVGSKLLFSDGTIQHSGVVINKNKLPYHIYRGYPSNFAFANDQRDYQIVTAACMLIRRDLFFEVGCFDERYINGYEDVDLCLKVGKQGKRVVYNPKSILIHYENKSEGRQDKMDFNRRILLDTWKNKIEQDDYRFLLQDGEILFKRGYIDEAKQVFEQILILYPNQIEAQNKLSIIAQREPKLKIGFLAAEPENYACPYIRLESPLTYLHEKGDIEYINLYNITKNNVNINLGKLAQLDIIIVQRQMAYSLPFDELVKHIKRDKTKIIYEADDLFSDLPSNHIAYKYYIKMKPNIEEYIKNADLVTVSTVKLKSFYSYFNNNIVVLPNSIDVRLWSNNYAKNKKNGKIRILFSGTITHGSDLQLIENVIIRIINEFGDKVTFLLWGNTTERLKKYRQIEVMQFSPDYLEYAKCLKKLNVDFAVVSLENNAFNQVKSHIKWLEYSICKIPGIYSNIGAYSDYIEDGKTGILVENTQDAWYNAIHKFIIDEDFRLNIGQQTYEEAIKHHTLEHNAHLWLETYRSIASSMNKKESTSGAVDVSIIMPVYNRLEFTKKCIDSIYKNTNHQDYEIIIIDNGSSDGTRQYLEQLEKKKSNVKVIYNEENLGFAKANNQAATIASGKYFVFLNNDTEPLQGWLEEMVKLAESDESIGVVGSKLLYPNGTIQHAGVAIGRDRVPYHIFKGCDANDPRVNKLREFKIVTGACLLISRELFMNMGMLDEEFINGHEDIDLCFRVKERGKKVIYCPNSVLYHYESISEGRMDSREHNLERTFKKWGEKLVQDDQEYLEIPCKESELNARKKKIAKTSDLKFAIKIGTPDRSVKHWGDIYYARCLLKALERAGCQGEIHYRNEWNTQDKDVDVVIHLRGLGVYEPKPYNVNLMWLVSHPSLVTPEELENYDGILVASREYADILKRSLDTPVIYLPQATDPEHFRKIDTCSKEYNIVFIGNNYNGQAGRQIIKDLLSAEFDFKLWGKGWDGIVPPKFIMGDFVTWDELPLVYNKTRVVLNDHHYFMKMFGFVNNRTFDVAACGTFLISDKVKNIESQIPIITYDNEKDLTSLIYYYLEHEQERESKANEVKRLVVEIFTFDQSVKQILDFLKKIEPVKSEKRYSIPEIGQSRLLRFLETVNTCYELSDKKTAKQMLLQYTALLEKQGIAR